MSESVPDPASGDKYPRFRDRASGEVVLRLIAIDKARELIDPDDPRAAAALAAMRRRARWQAEAHRYANSERRP